MVDTQCHSFEEASQAGNHKIPSFPSHSQSDFSKNDESIRLTESATTNLSFFESPTSQSLSHLPKTPMRLIPALRSKENRISSPERGRSRVRAIPSPAAARTLLRGPVSPDRFIPKRNFVEPTSVAFRVVKNPKLLSPRERLFRRLPPGDDPFLPAVARRNPTGRGNQQPTRLRRIPHHRPHLVTDTGSNDVREAFRQVSPSAIWNVGGASAARGDTLVAPANHGTLTISNNRSTAPNFVARFLPKKPKFTEGEIHELRLALALNIDPATRLLSTSLSYLDAPLDPTSPEFERLSPFVWKDSAWKKVEREHWPTSHAQKEIVPPKPFRILDAPYLRDDFYCSTLAYSVTSGILAVGLGHQVYLWSEGHGVDHPPFGDVHPSNYVTSLSFSSEDGGRSILAVARRSGQLSLWSTLEKDVRFEISHPNSITCVAFKPKISCRLSERVMHTEVEAEELVAGDELGNIWYYSVEWSSKEEIARWKWNGSMTLLAKICAHTQQICGLTWSPDEKYLATGGNDNVCLLFELDHIVPPQPVAASPVTPNSPSSFSLGAFPYHALGTATRRLFYRRPIFGQLLPSWVVPPPIRPPTPTPPLLHAGTLITGGGRTILVPFNRQKHRLYHSAAVKAIAFAPWQPSLLATGGGSNDRTIHFYHTRSGACLATINVFAQVTSLIWSQTRHEITATFGYAKPDHPVRIAVFAWPSCAQVAVVPWGPYGASWDGIEARTSTDCGRALWAIRYPGKLPRSLSTSLNGQDRLRSPASPTGSVAGTSGSSSEGTVRRVRPRMVTPREKEGGIWCARTLEEGCIIVASSDQTVKFHEVWTGRRASTRSACGLFGGSDILEGLEGIEKSGEVIR